MIGRAKRNVVARVFFALGLAFLAAVHAKAQHSGVAITQAGPQHTMYRWLTDRCEEGFIPDAPARAFRRADGAMTLIATHHENWMLSGRDFSSLRPSCRAVMRSSEHRETGAGKLWIEATYTLDGKHVIALVSQDLEGRERQAGCYKRDVPGRCWLNNIVAARSNDMGQTFSLLEPASRTVATLGDAYPQNVQSRFGVFTTSNIVRRGAEYHMIAYAQGEGVQEPGNCLFRTDDPFAPERWRAWDGSGFSIDLRLPAAPRPCKPLNRTSLPNEVRSVTYDSRHGVWIAVFAARLKMLGDAEAVPGFYYSQSADLVEWGAPQRIMRAPTRPRTDDPDMFMSYPSLLDPESTSYNFDTLDGENPVLLFTVQHLERGRGTMNRDLRYVPLRITVRTE